MSALSVEESGSVRWLEAWEGTGREPFAHPAFGALFAGPGDHGIAACWEDDGGLVLLPLLLRAVPDDTAEHVGEGPWRDAVSPYGYGGPFVSGEPDLAAFWEAFLAWMREARVLSCFEIGRAHV